jgi:hypothetical protein
MRGLDRNFGVKNQAMAVLCFIDELGFIPRSDYPTIYTRPWYNGRECGFVVSLSNKSWGKVIHIAVFEHRNSESICALKWETTSHYWNHPLEDENIFHVAYGEKDKDKHDFAFSVGYGEVGKMADYVYEQLENFYGV